MSVWVKVCEANRGKLLDIEGGWFACSFFSLEPETDYYATRVYKTKEEAAKDFCVAQGLLMQVMIERGAEHVEA
jgi:hypothetical protein